MAANIWLISDMHLFHENMYRFTTYLGGPRVRERFANAAEGDAYMIEAWNAVVKPEDHVWNLGDVTLDRGSQDIWKLEKVMKQLNGHKRLVLGNHDHYDARVYRNVGFEKVKGFHRHEGLVYSHVPLHPESIKDPRVLANVHGHIHANETYPGKYVNVSVERINYQPVAFEEVVAMARRKVEVQHG